MVVGSDMWLVCYVFLSFFFFLWVVSSGGFRQWRWVPIWGEIVVEVVMGSDGVVVCYRFFEIWVLMLWFG